jgi:3-oxoacyl-[acyl-carrier protein] reductase
LRVSLRDQVIVITGASRGIGRATALEIAEDGPRLALLGRDEEALGNVVQQAARLGAEVRGYAGDLRDHARTSQIADQLLQDFGRVDVLVNNAAVGKYGSFLDLQIEDWRRQFDVNILGLVAITRAILPAMLARRSGHILNVSSVQGITATATSAAYSATKFALMGISQSMALDLGPKGIRVSVICPGSVETDFDGFPGHLKSNPLKPHDVALAIRGMLESGGRAHMSQVVLVPTAGPDQAGRG